MRFDDTNPEKEKEDFEKVERIVGKEGTLLHKTEQLS